MKAAQIERYSKEIKVKINDIPIPSIKEDEVLVRVKAAAVNPVDILNLKGSVRLIQDYKMPLTMGKECSGVVEKIGSKVKRFHLGDKVYSRIPIKTLGAFAEFVSIKESALAHMAHGLDYDTAAATPLTGLTAYEAITEELKAKPGESLFIPGGSGSFGQMAVPILSVVVSGNKWAKEAITALGAERYIVYTEENYEEVLPPLDYVIDTLGEREFEKELSILRKGGRCLVAEK